MLKTVTNSPAYAYALALRDSGVDIDPENFASLYESAKAVWKMLHPFEPYYVPSEFYRMNQKSRSA